MKLRRKEEIENKEDGCWNCIYTFEDPENSFCKECINESEWLEIDPNPYDYSMDEVWDWANEGSEGDEW